MSFVCSRTIEMLNDCRFSTSTRRLRSKTTPRGARSGKRPLVVVLRHHLELLVLDDLQHPEADGEHREHDDHQGLKHRQPGRDFSAIFNGHGSPPD